MVTAKSNINIPALVNQGGCFNLQFRKDIRHERTNAPTYYRWKIQFIVTLPKEQVKVLEKIKKTISCGKVCISKDQARYSVQKIDDIQHTVVPFFRRNKLTDNKKKDFELWQKAADIIYQNKGRYLTKWKKNDLLSLIEIQKSSMKHKNHPKQPKWIQMAQAVAKTI